MAQPTLKFFIGVGLFDHLVGERAQLERHVEAERLGGLEVDHQLELGRLRDRQVGGLFAIKSRTNSLERPAGSGGVR
jgi:hypothetical protein